MENFYSVLVATDKYHGNSLLTYKSRPGIISGTLVEIPLRNQQVLGVVIEPDAAGTSQKIKPITSISGLQLPEQSLDLIKWFMAYYPAPIGAIGQLFLPSYLSLKQLGLTEEKKEKIITYKPEELPPLTKSQAAVLKQIQLSNGSRSFLLHGDTGSGKTRVYMEIIKSVLKEKKSAFLLAPEISLTPQLVRELEKIFGGQVILMHSRVPPKQKRQNWQRILLSKTPIVVVGPRSALFTPLKHVGAIIVDEAHEPAYKSEKQPRYQTIRVASALAKMHGALMLSGSATPLISEYHYARIKKLPILRMAGLAKRLQDSTRQINFVDIKDKSQFSKHPLISDQLISAIKESLENQRQAMLFLNRRGTARVVLCNNCGWSALCPNCGLPLIYHAAKYRLRCHTCGFTRSAFSNCPQCSSADIVFKSFGTQAIEDFISRQFPRAKIARMDSDSPANTNAHLLFEEVADKKIDILIGTQVLAKGLDLPNLSLVGVLLAEGSLTFPDYTADERTYQLLHQVIGRVARGHGRGSVIIQSSAPENPVLQQAAHGEWDKFYNSQIKQRQIYGYPPFYHVMKLSASRKNPKLIEKHARELAARLSQNPKLKLLGPAPGFIEKQAGKYIWQIVVKAKNRSDLTALVPALPPGWSYDIDPTNLL